MPRPHLLAGRIFGRLTVLDKYEARGAVRFWLCHCECGNEKFIATASLTKGKAKACGCRQFAGNHRTHGMTKTRIFGVWKGMKTRCTNPNATGYKNYGGRGIKVCERWMESFENFYADMGATYQDELTIERSDNNGNYEPGNCYWAAMLEQGSNSRKNVIIDTPQGSMHVAEAARISGIDLSTLYHRATNKWPVDRIFEPPKDMNNGKPTKRHKPKETTP